MSIKCDVAELSEALAIAASATLSKGNDLLKNVFVIADRSSMNLYATDNEVSAEVRIGASSDSSEEFLIPTRRMSSILSEINTETVELIVTDNWLRVRSSGADFRLASESSAEFPRAGAVASGGKYRISSEMLKKVIRRTMFACDTDSTRYALGGVLFELEGNTLICAGTDSRRLAVSRAAVEGEGVACRGVIPLKVLKMLERLPACDVDISITDKSAVFQSDKFTFTSRVVDGRFPRWRDVVPRSFKTTINVISHLATTAVRQSQVVTTEDARGVTFRLENQKMMLRSEASDVGSSDVELVVSAPEVAELQVSLDPKYVADFLKCVPGEELVYWKFNGNDEAVVMTDGDSYDYVIMPLAAYR